MGFRGRLVPPAEDKEEQEVTMNPVACGLGTRMRIWRCSLPFTKEENREGGGHGEGVSKPQ